MRFYDPVSDHPMFPGPGFPTNPWWYVPYVPATTIQTSTGTDLEPTLEQRVSDLEMRLNLLEDEVEARQRLEKEFREEAEHLAQHPEDELQTEVTLPRCCKNCLHWHMRSEHLEIGICEKVVGRGGFAKGTAYLGGRDTDQAELWTHQDFSCSMHKPKPD